MNTKKSKTLALLLAASSLVFAQEDDFAAWGDSTDSQEEQQSVTVSGSTKFQARAYPEASETPLSEADSIYDMSKIPVTVKASAQAGIAYTGTSSDAEIKLAFDKDILENHPESVLDEMNVRGYLGSLTVEAGKMKIVWGKGDKLHVIDNFNADDYTDFIIPDYIDRRLAVPMMRAVYNIPGTNTSVEAVWTPWTEPDRFASDGIWTPAAYKNLYKTVKELQEKKVAASFKKYTELTSGVGALSSLAALAQAEAAAETSGTATAAYKAALEKLECSSPDDAKRKLEQAGIEYTNALLTASTVTQESLLPDTHTLRYSQFGARVTGTVGTVDLGASWYYGHFKQPSANLQNTILNSEMPELAYDQKQTFGLEAATVLWKLNLRGEAAYTLTEDTEGDDPWVHNNSVSWLAGFDMDIGLNNININVQETGTLVLNGSKIDGSTFEKYDVDYNPAGHTNNKLVVNITDSWMNEKICPEVTVMWGIERGDLVVQPKLEWKPDPALALTLSGMYIKCRDEDSEFYEWRNNSFVCLGVSAIF